MEAIIRPRAQSVLILGFSIGASLLLIALLSGTSFGAAATMSFLVGFVSACMLWQLKAVVTVRDGQLTIDYLRASFVDKVENLEPRTSEKFGFRSDSDYGLHKLYRGTRILGFYVGWYILNNGSLGFACVSKRHRARALFTKDGVPLILDPGVARAISGLAT